MLIFLATFTNLAMYSANKNFNALKDIQGRKLNFFRDPQNFYVPTNLPILYSTI